MQILGKRVFQAEEKQRPEGESMPEMLMELHVGQCG